MKTHVLFLVFSVCCLSVLTAPVLAEDEDYGNVHTAAYQIPADGTVTYGELDSEDVDWFAFDCPGYTQFRITFSNGEGNWKLLRFYQANEFGDPVEIMAWWQGGVGSSFRTVFIESSRTCYLRVENDGGSYSVQVETLVTTAPDSYADECPSATPLVVNDPAITGILDHTDPLNYDHDWFVFATEPLHMYRIRLWYLDNCNVWFRTFNDTCATEIYGGTTEVTLVSWYGDDFRIYVDGEASRAGNLYWLEVTDIGDYTDDHSNTWDLSTPVPTDGTPVEALINYNATLYSDIDWFTFTPQAHSKYTVNFANGENNWKLIRVYQANIFGDPAEISAWWQGGVSEGAQTFYFEYARPCYLKVDTDGGRYSVDVAYVETFLPDTYSNSCVEPTPLAADGQTVTGVLNHTNPYDEDWFVIDTEPLHMYQVQISYLNGSNVWFETYNAGCNLIYGGTTNVTFVSWKGEPYKIRVMGEAARVGNYYMLTATDIGTYTDDHGNIPAEATPIPKDNTSVAGVLNYAAMLGTDQDWFTFIAGREDDYQFTLENMNGNWKLMRVYYEDEVGQVIEIGAFWAGGVTTVTQTYHLLARRHFIKVDTDLGEYFVRVLSPEPHCGDLDHPYPAGDTNRDCYVNMADLAQMAATWMNCTDPLPPCSYIP